MGAPKAWWEGCPKLGLRAQLGRNQRVGAGCTVWIITKEYKRNYMIIQKAAACGECAQQRRAPDIWEQLLNALMASTMLVV